MLLKNWNMYIDIIMNMTVYNSAYVSVYLSNAKRWVRLKAKSEKHIRNAHIKSVYFFTSETFEFYECKMELDVEIVALSMLLHNSKFNNFSEFCVRCHFLILS